MQSRPLIRPILDDPDTSEYFRAAGARRLVVRACDECGQSLHLPRVRCFTCGSLRTSWHEVEGSGRIYTWTVVEHQVHPVFETPFTSILVELEERPDVRLVGYLPGRPRLEEGTRVRVRFDDLGGGFALPGWDLDEAEKTVSA